MRVLVNREALQQTLKLFSGVVLTRTTKPILTCILMTAKEKRLILRATNMEIVIDAIMNQVDVSKEGTVAVPYGKLSEIVGVVGDNTVTLTDEGKDVLSVKTSHSLFRVFCHPIEEFPPMSIPDPNGSIKVLGEVIRDLIARTEFAMSRELSNYAINGLLLECRDKSLHAVATDGHRLSLAKAQLTDETAQRLSVVVPTKAVEAMLRAIEESDEVRIQNSQNRITVWISGEDKTEPHVTISSAVLEGTFPPYSDVIPTNHPNKFTVMRDRLIDGLRQASIFTCEESKGLRFSCGDSMMKITSRDAEAGEAKVDVQVDRVSGGGDVEVGFNPKYMADFAKAASTEEITMEFNTGNKAGLFRSGPDYLYVVMPMQTS